MVDLRTIDQALLRIRDYAIEREMSAEQIEESFLGGWFASQAMRKDWHAAGEPEQN